MFTMKQVCDQLGMTYETLRFYDNEGLIPNTKRNKNNYRVFDENDVAWIKGLQCLRRCGISIKDMKIYMQYSIEGISSIPDRKKMLALQKEILQEKMNDIQESIDYIDNKQIYFDKVLQGETKYISSLHKNLQTTK